MIWNALQVRRTGYSWLFTTVKRITASTASTAAHKGLFLSSGSCDAGRALSWLGYKTSYEEHELLFAEAGLYEIRSRDFLIGPE